MKNRQAGSMMLLDLVHVHPDLIFNVLIVLLVAICCQQICSMCCLPFALRCSLFMLSLALRPCGFGQRHQFCMPFIAPILQHGAQSLTSLPFAGPAEIPLPALAARSGLPGSLAVPANCSLLLLLIASGGESTGCILA